MNNSFLLPFTTWEEIGVHNFSLKKIKLCGKEIVTSSPHENLHWIWDPERPNNLPNITIIIISRGRTLTKGTLLEYLPKMIGVTDRERAIFSPLPDQTIRRESRADRDFGDDICLFC